MASSKQEFVHGLSVINQCVIYNSTPLVKTEDIMNTVYENAIEGLRIMSVVVNEKADMVGAPVETGVQIYDCKVRQPRRISVKGICDNIRGEVQYDKSVFPGSGISGLVGGVVKSARETFVTGSEFTASQQILTRARNVYAKIHKMYEDTLVHGAIVSYTISTKGAIYPDMILESIDQLNDAEHLMVIPVTLNFREMMYSDQLSSVTLDEQDSPMTMSGSAKKGNIFEETYSAIKSALE